MIIEVEVKNIYGKDTFYPLCHKALLLAQLSRMTGKSVEQLKRILMPDYYQSN